MNGESSLLTKTEYSHKREIFISLLLLAVAFAIYWQSLANGFLINWDDPNYIVNNPDAHGFSPEHLKNAFSRFYVGNYAPLQMLSYMLDYSLWGLKPAGYIFHNILLHALNSYLLYRIVYRVCAGFWPALLSALLFLVHPVQVESVVWISQRKNLLAMLFFLVAMLFYMDYRKKPAALFSRQYLLSAFFFACALLAKSVAVILPPVLLLYDICIDRRPFRQAINDKVPFVLLALAASLLAFVSQSGDHGGGGRTAFHGGSPYLTLLTMLPVFAGYLKMLLLPTTLSAVYSPGIKTAIDPSVAASGIFLLFLLALMAIMYRKQRRLFFWGAVAIAGIVPVSQIVPLVTLMNDRYLYFPMAGFAPFVILGLTAFIPPGRAELRCLAAALSVMILIAFGVISSQRGVVWKDSVSLWSDAVRNNPKDNLSKYNLANSYSETGNLEKMGPLLQELLTDEPDSARNQELAGHYYYRLGGLENAEKSYKRALELNPSLPNALFSLGNIFLAKNDLARAEDSFLKALKYRGLTPDLSYSLACLASLKGEPSVAMKHLENAFRSGFNGCEAVRINPELDSVRARPEYTKIITTYCKEREKK